MAKLFLFSLLLCFRAWVFVGAQSGGLSYGFYQKSCPQAEAIVKREVTALYYIHGNTAVSFLRNIFHDCAVQGCDGSLLLDSTPGHLSEKESDKNFGLRNFKYVEVIKKAVEKECPGVVSCADILILSGRDGIGMLGGPSFQVKTGRRDTRESSSQAADTELLATDVDVTTLLQRFSELNLNTPQTVALLGAHTVGRTHCKNLVQRLYPTVDKTLNSTYASYLKLRCPSPKTDPEAVEYSRNDRITPMGFDNNYYKNVVNMKGLLKVDNALYLDPRTAPYVTRMAADNSYFFQQFVEAMAVLTEYNVLTGNQGEIRTNCKWVN